MIQNVGREYVLKTHSKKQEKARCIFLYMFLVAGKRMNKKSIVALIIAVIIAAIIATPFIIWNAMKPQDEITTGVLVEKMNDLNELVTAEAITKVAIQKENNKIFGQEINLDIPGTGQKVLVIVPGTVQAGVKLDQLTKKNVTVNNEKKK